MTATPYSGSISSASASTSAGVRISRSITDGAGFGSRLRRVGREVAPVDRGGAHLAERSHDGVPEPRRKAPPSCDLPHSQLVELGVAELVAAARASLHRSVCTLAGARIASYRLEVALRELAQRQRLGCGRAPFELGPNRLLPPVARFCLRSEAALVVPAAVASIPSDADAVLRGLVRRTSGSSGHVHHSLRSPSPGPSPAPSLAVSAARPLTGSTTGSTTIVSFSSSPISTASYLLSPVKRSMTPTAHPYLF